MEKSLNQNLLNRLECISSAAANGELDFNKFTEVRNEIRKNYFIRLLRQKIINNQKVRILKINIPIWDRIHIFLKFAK